jgi:GNAT superfamily N-acetyltransferase
MKIRIATIYDLAEIQKLNLLLFKEEYEWDNSLNLGWTFSEIGTAYFKSAIQSEHSCVYIIHACGEIFGYIAGSESEDDSYRIGSKMFVLDDMYVLKEGRNKGAGSMLYKAFYDWSIKQGANRWKVDVTFRNKKALMFYAKMGLISNTVVLEKKLVGET